MIFLHVLVCDDGGHRLGRVKVVYNKRVQYEPVHGLVEQNSNAPTVVVSDCRNREIARLVDERVPVKTVLHPLEVV
jgi:hypothetical protein